MSSWILSSFVSERVFFWTIMIVIVSELLLLSLCVLFGLSCCVLGCVSWVVVGCSRVVQLIGTSPCTALSFPLPPLWLRMGCVVVVLVGAGRVVVVFFDNSPSPSLWFVSFVCCACAIVSIHHSDTSWACLFALACCWVTEWRISSQSQRCMHPVSAVYHRATYLGNTTTSGQ